MAEKLKIIPLGGLNEIGKNMTVLEYGKDMIVVDCAGAAHPKQEIPFAIIGFFRENIHLGGGAAGPSGDLVLLTGQFSHFHSF